MSAEYNHRVRPISNANGKACRLNAVTPLPALAADAGAAEAQMAQVAHLRDQVSVLVPLLSNAFLRDVTIGELAQPL